MKVPIEHIFKGRVAETVFEEMFGNKERFRVLHFGFEYISAELTQVHRDWDDETFKMISKTPDFLLHDLEDNQLYLVECKYRSRVQEKEIFEIAQTLNDRHWGLAKIFIASPQGFYFDDVESIIARKGICARLDNELISLPVQNSYLKELVALFKK